MKCNCGREGRYMQLSGDKEVYSCNKYKACPTYAEMEKRVDLLTSNLRDFVEAMEYTRQYVGYATLPPIKGWSWFDADNNARITLGLPLQKEGGSSQVDNALIRQGGD